MSLLSVTNTFVSGTIIRSADVNQNFTDVISWANGNISQVNFSTMTGSVNWSVSSNAKSISSTNTGNQGSALFAHNGTLGAGLSAFAITSNAAQSLGKALLEVTSTNASNAIDGVRITDPGPGPSLALNVVSTTKGSIPAPKMTTAQRNAIASPVEGTEIWNTDTKRKEVYNGTNWTDGAGRTGEIVDYAGGTLPPDRLACDGSVVSQSTYAALYARIGSTWNTGGEGAGNFRLPDSRGRAAIGAGTGSGLSARTLAATGGEETHVLTSSELASHSHSGNTGAGTDHYHTINNATYSTTVGTAAGVGTSILTPTGATASNVTASVPNVLNSGADMSHEASHTHPFTTSSVGSDTAHNNMQPFFVVNKAIII